MISSTIRLLPRLCTLTPFATTLADKGDHPSTAQKRLAHPDIRMTLATYTLAIEGTQVAATAALEEAFLGPAVDTPQKGGVGSSVKSLYYSAICRTFRSGGTRIRTGDTMIFSHIQRPLGMRIHRVGKRIYVRRVPLGTTGSVPTVALLLTRLVSLRGTGRGTCKSARHISSRTASTFVVACFTSS